LSSFIFATSPKVIGYIETIFALVKMSILYRISVYWGNIFN